VKCLGLLGALGEKGGNQRGGKGGWCNPRLGEREGTKKGVVCVRLHGLCAGSGGCVRGSKEGTRLD